MIKPLVERRVKNWLPLTLVILFEKLEHILKT